MINYGKDVGMNKAQLIDWIYQLSEEYLRTNYDKNGVDIGYNTGLKDGIVGFRNYLRTEIISE